MLKDAKDMRFREYVKNYDLISYFMTKSFLDIFPNFLVQRILKMEHVDDITQKYPLGCYITANKYQNAGLSGVVVGYNSNKTSLKVNFNAWPDKSEESGYFWKKTKFVSPNNVDLTNKYPYPVDMFCVKTGKFNCLKIDRNVCVTSITPKRSIPLQCCYYIEPTNSIGYDEHLANFKHTKQRTLQHKHIPKGGKVPKGGGGKVPKGGKSIVIHIPGHNDDDDDDDDDDGKDDYVSEDAFNSIVAAANDMKNDPVFFSPTRGDEIILQPSSSDTMKKDTMKRRGNCNSQTPKSKRRKLHALMTQCALLIPQLLACDEEKNDLKRQNDLLQRENDHLKKETRKLREQLRHYNNNNNDE